MDIKFSKRSITTGLELIDRQHQKYFQIISAMHSDLSRKEITDQFFKELYDYIVYHFGCEEDFMDKYHFDTPKAIDHKRQHAHFKDKVVELHRECLHADVIDVNLKMRISRLLIDWFVKHIQNTDKYLCQFILDHSVTNSGLLGKLKTALYEFTGKYGG